MDGRKVVSLTTGGSRTDAVCPQMQLYTCLYAQQHFNAVVCSSPDQKHPFCSSVPKPCPYHSSPTQADAVSSPRVHGGIDTIIEDEK